MTVAVAAPTINDVLNEFLAEQRQRVSQKTYWKYEGVIELLQDSLDGYAYQSLSDSEERFWRKRWDADEQAGSFCNTFGIEKVPDEVHEFLSYFLIRKVLGQQEVVNAGGTVVRKLAKWLAQHGHITAEQAATMADTGKGASSGLPKADKLGRLLDKAITVRPPGGEIVASFDAHPAMIIRIEPGKLWFGDVMSGDEAGPVNVPHEASELAEEGWEIGALSLGKTHTGWHILEMGLVYPDI